MKNRFEFAFFSFDSFIIVFDFDLLCFALRFVLNCSSMQYILFEFYNFINSNIFHVYSVFEKEKKLQNYETSVKRVKVHQAKKQPEYIEHNLIEIIICVWLALLL